MASKAIIQYSSSSSSSHAIITTYDVFVSFRGEDTRNNFTAFLFDALFENGIHAFKDDTHLQKGESIAPELLLAIQESRLFLVVFSKNYASSTWCLRELAHICNCTIEPSSSRVLPIFYDVDPSEVRKQSGYYGIAFAEHERRFREDIEKMEEVQRWREALIQVANISGWDIQNESQPAMIKEIVQKIKCRLGSKFQNLPNGNLVGMESRVKELEKCLKLESVSDVRVVGISGMGGIGKTTLASALYEKIAYQFDFHCFVDDVNYIYRRSGSLGVQKQLLSQCLNDKNLEICNASVGTYLIGTRLRNKRGLIVFDNVNQVEQLRMFTGSRETLLLECLGGGSRIIIISRDEHILRTHGVHHVYEVQPLEDDNAVQLFCKNAFKCDYIMSDYKMLTYDVLSHADGHPLAIEVIGKSLHGRNVSQWRGILVRLSDNKSKDIMDVLRISYDDLEENDREIFLDIACFFDQDYFEHCEEEILDFRGFNPEIGLQILVDKSLITIFDGRIYMHSLLRDLGKCIVREKSPKEPRKWSRLWECEDLYKVMSNNMEAKNLEAIVVDDKSWMFFNTIMRVDALSKMKNLKLLKLPEYDSLYGDEEEELCTYTKKDFFSGNLNYLSNELGYLIWQCYPFNSLPQCFQPHNLFELDLSWSSIQHLWDSTQPIPNLRRLNVSYCKYLIEVPNFGEALNLYWLNLERCERLKRFHPSVGFPRNLTYLNLRGCNSLVELPHFEQALKLEILDLRRCELLKQLPSSIGRLRKLTPSLELGGCKSLTDLPHFVEDLNLLKKLNLERCEQLRQIHPSIGLLRNLIVLNLRDCKSLVNLPHFVEDLNLARLNLEGCVQLRQIHPSIGHLRKLTALNLKDCKSLVNLPHFVEELNLEELNLKGCEELRQIDPSIGRLRKLTALNLTDCKSLVNLPHFVEDLNLQELNLKGCVQLRQIHSSIGHLRKLTALNLIDCKSLVNLPHFVEDLNLEELNLKGCEELRQIHPSIGHLRKLTVLNLRDCKRLVNLPHFVEELNLEELNLEGCVQLRQIHPSIGHLRKLTILNLKDCKSLRLRYLPELPSRTDWPGSWTPVKHEEYGLGLNIFNCPELVERDCCTNNCFSWMIQILQCLSLSGFSGLFSFPLFSSIIPGSEIPRWFKKEHVGTGNVINIDRSHFTQHYKNRIGIALGVIFVVHKERRMPPPDMEQPSILSITCGPSIPPQQREGVREDLHIPVHYREHLHIPVLFREDLVTEESDHVGLFFFKRPYFDELKVESRFRDLHDEDLYVEVKKYWYRWVYKQDLELLNLTTMHSKNSSPGKRKYLAIEENK
uniref:TIR domain-containing protein n=1 Tax=Glycine max TaxID=3847 RepID=A0A368UL68_SOYBN